jgi:hypothetical protein
MKKMFDSFLKAKKASKSKAATVRQAPEGLDEETLNRRYHNFLGMVEDITHFPEYGAKLLTVLMGSEQLFGRFICDQEMLAKLIAIDPARENACIDNVLKFPRCWDTLLDRPNNLRETIAMFNSPVIKDKILAQALSQEEIYSKLLAGQTSLNTTLEYFPERRAAIMEILAKDARVFEKCVVTSGEHFWAVLNDNPEYKERFFNHIVTDQEIYKKLVGARTRIEIILNAFPHRQTELMHFVSSHPAILLHEFPGFSMIDEFCKKYPQYRDQLFDAALAIASYPRREIQTWGRLTALYGYSPRHALAVEAMIVQQPEWVLQVVTFTQDFAQLCQDNIFKDLKLAFLPAVCFSAKKFTFHVDNEVALKKMITIVPDQAWKLRVYYQLHTVKMPLSAVIQELHTEAVVMDELKDYVAYCQKAAPLPTAIISAARQTIVILLAEAPAESAVRASLQALNAALEPAPSAQQVATLAKNFPKEKPAGETAGDALVPPPRQLPNGTQLK